MTAETPRTPGLPKAQVRPAPDRTSTPTPSKVDRPTRRRGRTRARLIEAAFAVFAERGFGRASIEEICEAAGYTRGAFYSNFSSLDELFFALYEHRAQLIADQVGGVLGRVSGQDTVEVLVNRVIEALTLDRDWIMVRTEFLLHAARSATIAATMTAHRTVVQETLARTLQDVVDLTDLPPALRSGASLARAVMAVHDGVVVEMLLGTGTEELKSWLRTLLLALLD